MQSADKEFVQFSNRDSQVDLHSESGQALVEYILVLIVTVGLVLGGIYQLNTAFKIWANNYFGSYVACLLETGELPSVGGTPGDSGLCNREFQPFTPLNGRRQIPGAGAGSSAANAQAAASRNSAGGNRPGAGAVGSGSGGSIGRFTPSRQSQTGSSGGGGAKGNTNNGNYTGSTGASSSGGYSANGGGQPPKERVDNRFAFENEKEAAQKRTSRTAQRSTASDASNDRKIRLRTHLKEDKTADESKPLTFGNFMKWLILAAIIIALVVVIGGQMLQVSKSME